ncbi:putative integral membrane protein [Brugia pahangi]|uniref:Ovule protein n=1 Tax=Brugia pahangi TaxID=6280 RepID=A0A0N4TWU4_BRUPA|nr:unnamed protein product [Brugia pahangi]
MHQCRTLYCINIVLYSMHFTMYNTVLRSIGVELYAVSISYFIPLIMLIFNRNILLISHFTTTIPYSVLSMLNFTVTIPYSVPSVLHIIPQHSTHAASHRNSTVLRSFNVAHHAVTFYYCSYCNNTVLRPIIVVLCSITFC